MVITHNNFYSHDMDIYFVYYMKRIGIFTKFLIDRNYFIGIKKKKLGKMGKCYHIIIIIIVIVTIG